MDVTDLNRSFGQLQIGICGGIIPPPRKLGTSLFKEVYCSTICLVMGRLRTCELLLSLCQCVGAVVVAPLKRELSAKLTGGLKQSQLSVCQTDLNHSLKS